ncbi:MAG: hypothetical protein CMP65_04055 [Flavobacteriales bacterium]|nr:hypothetical protein [Flavobacteriales bacterium]|tara:strand:- start:3353 stop:4144 length:792 start_codon:yes stop_codon:yes gene_type:complete
MYSGILNKMASNYANPIEYNFIIGDHVINFNKQINKTLTLEWLGKVQCKCGKIFKEFYRQSFCYQCFWNAPEASPSIFKPELCTADLGIEERDFEWEKKFQLAPHYVYLTNTSGVKVGITRKTQKITRWIDQGASQAVLVAEVPNRRLSGLIELELKKTLSDRTNWRKMLSGKPKNIEMLQIKKQISSILSSDFKKYLINDCDVLQLIYPVTKYPEKIISKSFKKQPTISGKLIGIKGQYLIFDENRVFNVRAHTGYIINLII